MVDAVAVAAEIKRFAPAGAALLLDSRKAKRSEEHTSELQSPR